MLHKYATFEVLSTMLVPAGATEPQLRSLAHRHEFDYSVRPGYLYVRSRAISSRCNENFDEFSADEIKKAYRTFIGKPTFVNHNNENHRRARGVVIDAALHEDRNPDGSPDTWVEALMEIDAVRFPILAKAIIEGHIDRTSMGTDVAYSLCSACGNRATTPSEYCQHIPRMKGQRIYRHNAKTGKKEGVLIREKCFGLGFFENSLLVEEPADPTAHMWGLDTRGLAAEAAQRTASAHAKPSLASPGHARPYPTESSDRITTTAASTPWEHMRDAHDEGKRSQEMGEYNRKRVVDLSNPDDLTDHLFEAHGWDESDLWRNSHPANHPKMMAATDYDRPLTHTELRGAHETEHNDDPTDYPDSVTLGDSHFHTASLTFDAGEKKKVKDMDLMERITHYTTQANGKKWNEDHPLDPDNIVAHWAGSNDHEKKAGEHWYPDAHYLCKHVGHDTDTPIHTVAGELANYSPQTHWATNMTHAARVCRTKVGIGGEGSGVFATDAQREAADRMIQGEHYKDVLKGPKTSAFAHLIHHGGNEDDDHPHVCVDRHALSVAAGDRATDVAYSTSGLGGKAKYQHATDVYHEAARRISKIEGRTITAHHVQATTWLTRQRFNENQDRELSKTAGSRSAEAAKDAIEKWNEYAGEHHPGLMSKEPGTGYSQHASLPDDAPEDVKHIQAVQKEHGIVAAGALYQDSLRGTPFPLSRYAFGEVVAPSEVDTLRDEECPVCGEQSSSFDGKTCQVCGFDAPPVMFRDPDLEKARNLDLRKDNIDDGAVPGQPGLTPDQQDANGGMPGEVPGSDVPGSDQVPVDPSMLDENGQPLPGVEPQADPTQIVQQQMEQLQTGMPLTPDMLGPDGELVMGGVPEEDEMEQGPEGPGGPEDPEGPEGVGTPQEPQEPAGPDAVVDPDGLDSEGNPVAPDGQEIEPERPGEIEPGTPDNGVASLVCPACGFQAEAQQPMSTSMDSQADPMAPDTPGDPNAQMDGTLAGDACPNCGQAQMMSVGEMEEQQQMQQQPQQGAPVQASRKAATVIPWQPQDRSVPVDGKPHCQQCGSTDREDLYHGDQGYTACCNERVVTHCNPRDCGHLDDSEVYF
jgi:ribosomal protein L37E